MISLTEAAVAKLKDISESEGIGHNCVRISLRGGGCAGMMHDMNFDDVQKENDEVIEQDSIKLFIDVVADIAAYTINPNTIVVNIIFHIKIKLVINSKFILLAYHSL